MLLRLIAPLEIKEYEVEWCEITTEYGSRTIFSGHAPMILVIKPGSMLRFGAQDTSLGEELIGQGIAHITRTSLTILRSIL